MLLQYMYVGGQAERYAMDIALPISFNAIYCVCAGMVGTDYFNNSWTIFGDLCAAVGCSVGISTLYCCSWFTKGFLVIGS